MLNEFNKICIYGVGLIGGSLARAYKKSNPSCHIVGLGRNVEKLTQAKTLGVIDSFSINAGEALEGVELLVFAIPVGSVLAAFEKVKPFLNDDILLTDVGSTKSNIVNEVNQVLKQYEQKFVPGHPIAGIEKSGAEAAFADLFQNRKVILTPTEHTNANAIKRITRLWQACGAEVIEMSAKHHDEVLAATSHLPHMLAFSLVDTLANMNDKTEIFKYAAGGFRDFTRIASSSPEMWQDICLANSDALVDVIKQFQLDLTELTKAIESNDKDLILNVFSRAKKARDQFCKES